MELNKLYDIATKENISVIPFKMKNKAIIGKTDEEYCIGLNYSKINNSCEEKEILAEELGHYYCNCLYNVNSNETLIRKKEYRARKWSFKTLVPYNKIKELKEKGCMYDYEFAEELNVSIDLIRQAYTYYKENSYNR